MSARVYPFPQPKPRKSPFLRLGIERYKLHDPRRLACALASLGLVLAGAYFAALSFVLYHLAGVGEIASLGLLVVGFWMVLGAVVVDGRHPAVRTEADGEREAS